MNTRPISISDIMSTVGIVALVITCATIFVLLILAGGNAYLDKRKQKRLGLLKSYTFPENCYSVVQHRFAHLTDAQVKLAFEHLRLYFEVCLVHLSSSSPKTITMPSKLVDVCWHVYICETREYRAFCKVIFGDFLHHESAVDTTFPLIHISADDFKSSGSAKLPTQDQVQQMLDFQNQLSVARTYQWSLAIETLGADESSSEMTRISKVPSLFTIDEELKIEDGYFHTPEVLVFLAKFDLKAAEAVMAKREADAVGGTAAACGDGGSCAGCGGSL